jgi:hypothetical protein
MVGRSRQKRVDCTQAARYLRVGESLLQSAEALVEIAQKPALASPSDFRYFSICFQTTTCRRRSHPRFPWVPVVLPGIRRPSRTPAVRPRGRAVSAPVHADPSDRT